MHACSTLDEPPDGGLRGAKLLAIGAVRALRRARASRRDVALVGFDDFPLADIVDPPLTVIRQDVARIGKTVADLLFARIEGDTSPPRHVVHEPSWSCAGPARSAPPS